MRIKVTYTFEYDANPEHYPEEDRESAQGLATYDYETDAAWFLTSCGDEPKLVATEVFPGYTDAGFGCKRCGCHNAAVECASLCVPCYRKTHPLTNGA
jgi:hypothetical protein